MYKYKYQNMYKGRDSSYSEINELLKKFIATFQHQANTGFMWTRYKIYREWQPHLQSCDKNIQPSPDLFSFYVYLILNCFTSSHKIQHKTIQPEQKQNASFK